MWQGSSEELEREREQGTESRRDEYCGRRHSEKKGGVCVQTRENGKMMRESSAGEQSALKEENVTGIM